MKEIKVVSFREVIEARRCPAILPPIDGILYALQGGPDLGLATQFVRILVDGCEVLHVPSMSIACGGGWLKLCLPIDLSGGIIEIHGDSPNATFTVFLDTLVREPRGVIRVENV